MEILGHKIAIRLLQVSCIVLIIGDWGYTYDCDWELHRQHPVEFGELPALCDRFCSPDCLPHDWTERDLILRVYPEDADLFDPNPHDR